MSGTGFFFFYNFTSENIEGPCLTIEISSILNVKNIDFFVYYIFLGISTCFKMLYECNTCNFTTACYVHTVKLTLLIYSQSENNSFEDNTIIQWMNPGISRMKM